MIELDRETGLILDKGDLQTALLAEVKADTLNCLTGGEWLKAADIKDGLPNRNGGQVSKAISALLGEGTVDRAGTGKRNDPYFYAKC